MCANSVNVLQFETTKVYKTTVWIVLGFRADCVIFCVNIRGH